MKTKRAKSAGSTRQGTPLAQLLEREHRPAPAPAPERVDGIVIGTLVDIAPDGAPIVAIPQFGVSAVAARALQGLGREQIGQGVALGFEGGNPARPIVLGALFAPVGDTPAAATDPAPAGTPVIREENGRVVVEAEGELELRCGKAVIRLDASGRIDIRGGYINTHASATQRIRGGSVQIN